MSFYMDLNSHTLLRCLLACHRTVGVFGREGVDGSAFRRSHVCCSPGPLSLTRSAS